VREYENDVAQLRIEFYQVMKWSNRSDDDIAADLDEMQATAARLGAAGLERLIAERMAKTDPVRVKAILDR
jgi:hypothetical protein